MKYIKLLWLISAFIGCSAMAKPVELSNAYCLYKGAKYNDLQGTNIEYPAWAFQRAAGVLKENKSAISCPIVLNSGDLHWAPVKYVNDKIEGDELSASTFIGDAQDKILFKDALDKGTDIFHAAGVKPGKDESMEHAIQFWLAKQDKARREAEQKLKRALIEIEKRKLGQWPPLTVPKSDFLPQTMITALERMMDQPKSEQVSLDAIVAELQRIIDERKRKGQTPPPLPPPRSGASSAQSSTWQSGSGVK